MKAIAFGILVFAKTLRCTATSESLRELANALEIGGPAEFHEVIASHDDRSAAISGLHTSVDVDLIKDRFYLLTFATADCEVLAEGLLRLAEKSDHSTISLSDLGILTGETSDYDLEFFKLDEIPNLKRDYNRSGSGGTWEGVLYHTEPTAMQFRQTRNVILDWAISTSDGYERELLAVTPEGGEFVDFSAAHDRLIDPKHSTYQIKIYIEHPLTVPYGRPHTGAHVWLTTETSEIIISEHCAASGDFQVDIRNFFAFRKVLSSLSKILNSTTVGWGYAADTWPMEQNADPVTFFSEDEMWMSFERNLEPFLSGEPIPPSVRAMFARIFAEEIK